VAADADLDVAARRIAWIKLMNSGQTCIAPDYVLADRSISRELTDRIVANIKAFRADEDGHGMRIVNPRQFDRLVSMIESTTGSVIAGGGFERSTLTIEPTVILDPSPDDDVMADEIFGPVLAVLTIESATAAIDFINRRPKPLALYVFTSSRQLARNLINRIPSGGVVVNHVAMHCLVPQLPFGGVGASGMGAYHGRWGFEALSHRRAVLSKSTRPDPMLVYPPYTDRALKIMRKLF
jgi:aldehyde dehydrogenase (NAD+)